MTSYSIFIHLDSILIHRVESLVTVRSHFLYIPANLRGTAANYNLDLMNYGVRPHRVLLCPRINLSDFFPLQ